VGGESSDAGQSDANADSPNAENSAFSIDTPTPSVTMTDAGDGNDVAEDAGEVPPVGVVPHIGVMLSPDTSPRLPSSLELSPGLKRKANLELNAVASIDTHEEAEARLGEADPHSLSAQSDYSRLCKSW
jgi:hypothetical protein